ncbi:MAG: NosD domain-containing protein [bacterium]
MLRKLNKIIVFVIAGLWLSFPVKFFVSSAFSKTAGTTGDRGKTYYVGKDRCFDQGPGSKDRPFCTIQDGVKRLKPGDTLIILPGSYEETIFIEQSGTADRPIAIKGTDREKVIFDGGCGDFPCLQKETGRRWRKGILQILNSRHIIVKDLTLRNVSTVGVFGWKSEDVMLTGLIIEGTGLSGVKFEDSKGIKIVNNRLSYINQGWISDAGEYSQAEESVTLKRCENVEVAFNHIANSLQEGIDVKEGTRNGIIHNNIVELVNRVAIYVNEADSIDVYQNVLRNIGFFRPQGSHQMVGTNSYFPKRRPRMLELAEKLGGRGAWVNELRTEPHLPAPMGVGVIMANGDLGDLEHPDRPAIETGRCTYINVYQNVIYNTMRGGISIHNEWRKRGLQGYRLDNLRIFNNVIYNVNRRKDHVGMGISLDFKITNAEIKNNILAFTTGGIVIDKWGFGGVKSMYKGEIPRSLDEIDVTVSNNLFYHTQAPTHWNYYEGYGDAFLSTDPLFVDPDRGRFQLKVASPAIDRGIEVGLAFTGEAPDLGAFEVDQTPRKVGPSFEQPEWQMITGLQKENIKERESEPTKVEKDCGTFSSLRMLTEPTRSEREAMLCFLKHVVRREPAQLLLKMEATNWDKDEYVLIRYRIWGAKGDGVLLEKKTLEVNLRQKFQDAKPWVQRVLPLSFVKRVIQQAEEQGQPYLACPSLFATITVETVTDPKNGKQITLPPYQVLKE